MICADVLTRLVQSSQNVGTNRCVFLLILKNFYLLKCSAEDDITELHDIIMSLLLMVSSVSCYWQMLLLYKPQDADFGQIWRNYDSRYPDAVRRAPRKLSLVSHKQVVFCTTGITLMDKDAPTIL